MRKTRKKEVLSRVAVNGGNAVAFDGGIANELDLQTSEVKAGAQVVATLLK